MVADRPYGVSGKFHYLKEFWLAWMNWKYNWYPWLNFPTANNRSLNLFVESTLDGRCRVKIKYSPESSFKSFQKDGGFNLSKLANKVSIIVLPTKNIFSFFTLALIRFSFAVALVVKK